MPGGDSGSGGRQPRPQAARERQQQLEASLPLDIVVEIAACSDPATLVRCAATCWEMRRRVVDDRRRLRLRHADCFVPSLLRGFFAGKDDLVNESKRYLVDTTAADATEVRRFTLGLHFGPAIQSAYVGESRNGLVLLVSFTGEELRVCDPATGLSQDLPPEPTFPTALIRPCDYVLLPGDTEGGGAGAVGRPFQLLNAHLDLSEHQTQPDLAIHTFSSKHDTWGPCTQIPIPNLHGNYLGNIIGRALVVGGAVHWLCRKEDWLHPTNSKFFLMKLHVTSAQVTISELPVNFPLSGQDIEPLLAMTSPSGSPILLVSKGWKIFSWSQSEQTMKWKKQAKVTDIYELVRFMLSNGGKWPLSPTIKLHLRWFAERSGLILIEIQDRGGSCGFIWLDLRSKKMVRWFSDPLIETAEVYGPYEIDLSSWIPNFSSTF